MKGFFITFEGVEGCGKTTQIELLHAYLVGKGHQVVLTREPGGTPIAEKIRHLLLDPENGAMADMAELLLYEAARAQHVAEKIDPALEAGAIVLCDRFADSTTAYQGAGRGLAGPALDALHHTATQGTWPHKTFVLDLPVEEGLQRASDRGAFDRIEQESLDFHERVRQGFLRLAQEEPERIAVIDAARPVEDIADDIRVIMDRVLQEERA